MPWSRRKLHGVLILSTLAACHGRPRPLAPQAPAGPPSAEVIATVDPAGHAPQRDPQLRDAPAEVAAVGPDASAAVSESAQPYVHFTRPMRPQAEALRFELEPHVEGATVWVDPYRAWFVPSEALVLGRSYRVRARGTLQRDDGTTIAVDQSWSLRTRAPWAELEPLPSWQWSQSQSEDESGEVLESTLPLVHAKTPVDVRVELPTSANALRGHVRARAWKRGADPTTAVPVPVRVYGEKQRHPLPDDLDPRESGLHIHPATRWPAGHDVEVVIDERFAPPGAGPLGAPAVTRFRVSEGPRVTMQCMEDHGDGCGPLGVTFQFDAPFSQRDLERIDISPRPKHFRREAWSDNSVSLYGDFGLRSYRVKIPADLRDRVGQRLAGPIPTEVAIVPPPPSIDLVGDRGTLRPGLSTTVGLESRWLHDATLRAAVPSDREWIAMQKADFATVEFPRDSGQTIERKLDLGPSGSFAWSSIALDVAALAGGKARPLFVEIVPGTVMDAARGRPQPRATRGLYQVTDLGLAAWLSPGTSRLQVRRLQDLTPVAGAQLEVIDGAGKRTQRIRTADDGFAQLPRDGALPADASVIVRKGDDRTLVPLRTSTTSYDELQSDIATERAIYLPGEQVSIVGWAAISTPTTEHGLARPRAGSKVELQLSDARGDVVARRTVKMTAHGKYSGRLRLPPTASLGRYDAVAVIDERRFTASFELRDVRAPAFEVQAAAVADARVRGETAEIVTHANYYFGGQVHATEARAVSSCQRRAVRPPGLDEAWSTATPQVDPELPWSQRLDGAAVIAGDGTVRTRVATDALVRGVDYLCTTDVAVQDSSFEEVGATATWFVYPTQYLAVKWDARADGRSWGLRAVDRDGKQRRVQAYKLELSRMQPKRGADDVVTDVAVHVKRCRGETRTSGDDARCDSGKLEPGRYRAVITATIDETPVTWEGDFWIDEPQRIVAEEPRERTWLELQLSTNAPAVGQTLVVHARGPTIDAHGVLAFSHLGLRRTVPFELVKGEAKIELPVTDAWIPQVSLHAFVVAPGPDAKSPPRHYTDSANVFVGSQSRRLDVAVEVPEVTHAGAQLPIAVHVKGPDGEPVSGRVAIWAVDEALHSLVAPRIPDLVATFSASRHVPTRFLETYSEVLRPYQTREDPFSLSWGHMGSSGGGMGAGHGAGGLGVRAGGVATPAARQKFEGTPIFIGDAPIDAKGNALVRGTMPDNLTTFRVTAIASADGVSGPGLARFGHSDARVRVTAPLIVRAVTPRILRPGDRAELAAIIQNLGGPDGEAELSLAIVDGKEHVEVVEPPALGMSMVAGGQAKLPFVVRAKSAGEVELELRASLPTGDGKPPLQDAVRARLEIAEPKELRQFAAAYGSLEDDGSFAVALARPRDLGRGGLEVDVELAGTMLAGLEPMARDLAQYPYGCVEQTSSGLLPLVALRGLSHQGFLDVAVDEHVAAGVARLRAMQVGGRGLGYWPGAMHVHLWGTAYALWVLEQVRAEGYEVPSSLTEGMRDELRARVGAELAQPTAGTTPATVWDRLEVDPVLATMTAHALVAAGDRPVALVAALHEHREQLPTFAKALLLMAAHALEPGGEASKTLLAELRKGIDEREGTATVRPGSSFYDEYFDTSARTDAMVLLALLSVAPDDAVIEPLARGLGELRGAGRLANTQERAYALLALSRYARARETVVPALTASAWIGEHRGREVALRGRTPASAHEHRHVAPPSEGAAPRVTLERKGQGRMYWRVGMSWTPRDAGRSADAHGIAIARELRTADGRDVSRVTAGELVALDVTVTVDRTQRYVAIELPLPPGLEAVDETLGKGARARVLAPRGGGWVSHRELWRDRALLFADALAPGEHVATVFLRATTPGSFRMPAAVAHAMYAPERRGHTAHATVEVVHAKHPGHSRGAKR